MTDDDGRRVDVPPEADGERLDTFLSARLAIPRSRLQRWIRAGRVTVSAGSAAERVEALQAPASVKPSHRLTAGDRIEYRPMPVTADERVDPEPGELAILHEDADLVALDKPAGLAMHPGAGRAGGTLANRLLAAYPELAEVGGTGRPGIVHRLDIDTTGVVVVARTEPAYLTLSADFAARRVDKTYLAICWGAPEPAEGRIELPIGRHPRRRKEMAVRPDGRPARTTYRVVATSGDVSLVRLGLETGRTHQIRVHLKATGHPLVGDPVYGEARWKAVSGAARAPLRAFSRPALHSWELTLRHPVSGESLTVTAPPPTDLRELWAAVGGADLGDILGGV